jgi:hypothetical protein
MRAGMESDEEAALIGGIDRGLPLADRLTEAVRAVGGYLNRVWQIGQALQAAGIDREASARHMHGDGQHATERQGPPPQFVQVNDAIADLFTPGELRLEPAQAGRLLLGLVLTNRMGANFGGDVVGPADLVDLFLHGAITTADRGDPS